MIRRPGGGARVAEGVPWSLCQGDVHENINNLVAGPKPQGGTTKKIWTLAKMGWNRELLKSGIALLRQASWSTICVEHCHVPTSKLKWLHPRYSKETLIVRSGLVSLSSLVTLSEDERKINKVKAGLARLFRKRPRQVGGIHMFRKSLFDLAHKKRKAGQVMASNMYRTIIAKASQRWEIMPLEQKLAFNRSAS